MNACHDAKKFTLRFWIALGAPALAWFVQLTTSYTIAAYACANDQVWILHTIGSLAFALAALGVWHGWKLHHAEAAEERNDKRFLATGALLLGGLFLLTIVVSELSNVLLDPCL